MRFFAGKRVGKLLLGTSASGSELKKILSWIIFALASLAFLIFSIADWGVSQFNTLLLSTPWLKYAIALGVILLFHKLNGKKTESGYSTDAQVRKLVEAKKLLENSTNLDRNEQATFLKEYALNYSCYSEHLKSGGEIAGPLDKRFRAIQLTLESHRFFAIKLTAWLIFWAFMIFAATNYSYSELMLIAFIPGFFLSLIYAGSTTSGDSYGFLQFILMGVIIHSIAWVALTLLFAFPILAVFKYILT